MNELLPQHPRPGQEFVDAYNYRWIYSKEGYWEKGGLATTIPRASDDSSGLMSYSDKSYLDSIPNKPGSFGLIVDTKTILKSPDNPDGILQGDIKLISDSLNIECVNGDLDPLTCPPSTLGVCNEGDNVPGLKFSIKEEFLKTFIVDHPGPTGRTGSEGPIGPRGKHGFGDGPQGDKGTKGLDSNFDCELVGIEYEDLEGVTESPISLMRLEDDGGCKLIAYRVGLDLPNLVRADMVRFTQPISRVDLNIKYENDKSDLSAFKIIIPPNISSSNYNVIKLSESTTDDGVTNFNAVMSIREFIAQLAALYTEELNKVESQYAKQVKVYIESLDTKVKAAIASLADRLASCEFGLPVFDHCIVVDNCNK